MSTIENFLGNQSMSRRSALKVIAGAALGGYLALRDTKVERMDPIPLPQPFADATANNVAWSKNFSVATFFKPKDDTFNNVDSFLIEENSLPLFTPYVYDMKEKIFDLSDRSFEKDPENAVPVNVIAFIAMLEQEEPTQEKVDRLQSNYIAAQSIAYYPYSSWTWAVAAYQAGSIDMYANKYEYAPLDAQLVGNAFAAFLQAGEIAQTLVSVHQYSDTRISKIFDSSELDHRTYALASWVADLKSKGFSFTAEELNTVLGMLASPIPGKDDYGNDLMQNKQLGNEIYNYYRVQPQYKYPLPFPVRMMFATLGADKFFTHKDNTDLNNYKNIDDWEQY